MSRKPLERSNQRSWESCLSYAASSEEALSQLTEADWLRLATGLACVPRTPIGVRIFEMVPNPGWLAIERVNEFIRSWIWGFRSNP